MKIRSIKIDNFRAIKSIDLSGLEDTVVIAGPNGCGKSCIFDAIRLLKSVYGGYQENEWQQWFGEFQINVHTLKEDVKRILNDKTKPLRIAVGFEFNEEEKSYFREKGPSLIEANIWKAVFPQNSGNIASGAVPAAEVRHHQPNVDARKKQLVTALLTELEKDIFWGDLNVTINGKINITSSPLLELCFTSYDPKNIGLIDYHGANRTYNREQVGGINLNIQSSEQNLKNHALYNSVNKYNNVKSEMAGAYVRELLAREADVELNERQNVIETLKELFTIFFPGKTFLGPKPSAEGSLTFPVALDDGSTHDINELSSGEKEVLYGYLRLQNTSPNNSILLLDEPELHLNPRLIRGLPKFYQKHLGMENNNQIWLVTHSDAFLRETVGEPGFSVFHMKSSLDIVEPSEQLVQINADQGIEAAFIDLVGDLAAYSPNSKIVIFEGGGDSDFDLKLVTTLFPEIVEKVNPISGENKTKVRQLHNLLEKASSEGALPYEFYSIVDWDTEDVPEENERFLRWDVYHIENYLLEPKYICKAINDLDVLNDDLTENHVETLMKECAEAGVSTLLIHRLRKYINSNLIRCIDLGIDPNTSSPGADFTSAVGRSATKVTSIVEGVLKPENILSKEQSILSDLHDDLSNGKWKNTFRGRDILKALVGKIDTEIKYETFRNLIISRMRDDGFRPTGMNNIVIKIIDD